MRKQKYVWYDQYRCKKSNKRKAQLQVSVELTWLIIPLKRRYSQRETRLLFYILMLYVQLSISTWQRKQQQKRGSGSVAEWSTSIRHPPGVPESRAYRTTRSGRPDNYCLFSNTEERCNFIKWKSVSLPCPRLPTTRMYQKSCSAKKTHEKQSKNQYPRTTQNRPHVHFFHSLASPPLCTTENNIPTC